jgi:hypothetical protein
MVPTGSDEKTVRAAGLCDTLRETEVSGVALGRPPRTTSHSTA